MYIHVDGLYERDVGNELIVYDPRKDRLFLLNQTSAAIWDLCDGQLTFEEITEHVATCFQVPRDRIVRDTKDSIAELEREGLIIERSRPDA